MTLEVLEPGTTVKINGELPGRISKVIIGSNDVVAYECYYWIHHEQRACVVTPEDIMVTPKAKTKKIGFHTDEKMDN